MTERVPFQELVELIEQNFQVTTEEAHKLANRALRNENWKTSMGIAKYEYEGDEA